MRIFSLWIMICLLIIVGGFGCYQEGIPPTSPPSILTASLKCSQQGTQYYLDSFSMVVEDANGSETLLDPSVEVLSVALPLTSTPILSARGKANQENADANEMANTDEEQSDTMADDTPDDAADDTPDDIADEMPDEMIDAPEVETDSCTFDSCKMRYTWSADDASETSPVLCGEDGLALVAQVRIMDESGRLQQNISVNSEPR